MFFNHIKNGILRRSEFDVVFTGTGEKLPAHAKRAVLKLVKQTRERRAGQKRYNRFGAVRYLNVEYHWAFEIDPTSKKNRVVISRIDK